MSTRSKGLKMTFELQNSDGRCWAGINFTVVKAARERRGDDMVHFKYKASFVLTAIRAAPRRIPTGSHYISHGI